MQIEPTNSQQLVPVIDSNTEIFNFDKNEFLLSHKVFKYQIKLNNNAYKLFSLISLL